MGEAARALDVSLDTLRRWDAAGTLATTRDARNRRRVPLAEIERLGRRPRKRAPQPGATRGSARNRLPGVVRSVEADGVMALVEVEAGPFTVVAAVTRDAIEDLALVPGSAITAVVKATSVMLQREP